MSGLPLNVDWQQILLHLLNFVLLFGILYFLLYKPVKEFMQKRVDYYKDMDDKAKAGLAQAEQAKSEYEDKLKNVNAQIEQMKQDASAKLQEEKKRALENAGKEAEKIVADAKDKASKEHDRMIADARNEITELIGEAAEKIVMGGDVSESYDSFFNSVEGKE